MHGTNINHEGGNVFSECTKSENADAVAKHIRKVSPSVTRRKSEDEATIAPPKLVEVPRGTSDDTLASTKALASDPPVYEFAKRKHSPSDAPVLPSDLGKGGHEHPVSPEPRTRNRLVA